MVGRRGSDFARNTAETFHDQLLETPACAVTCQHGEIVQVNGRAAMRHSDFIVVDFAEPVIRSDCTGIGENQTTDGICDSGVLFDAPVVDLQVIIDEVFVVEKSGVDIADLFALLAVQNICFRNICVAGLGEDFFHTVLNTLDIDLTVDDFAFKVSSYVESDQLNNARMILLFKRHKSFCDGVCDLADLEICDLTVPFNDFVHMNPPFV